MVRCGTPLDDDAIEMADPLIVVEVVSPSSGRRDSGSKLGRLLPVAVGAALSDRHDP